MGLTRDQALNIQKEILLKAMGNRMRDIRQSLNWSQTELAQKLSCDQPKISAIEKGVREPNPEYLIKFALTTGTSTDYLLLIDNLTQQSDRLPDYPEFVTDMAAQLLQRVALSKQTQDFFKGKHADNVLKGNVPTEVPGQDKLTFSSDE